MDNEAMSRSFGDFPIRFDRAGAKEILWHDLRANLAKYIPDILATDLLQCPMCGRMLPKQDFTIEHIIPRRVLEHDPRHVLSNDALSTNVRAKLLLLCNKPMIYKGVSRYNLGCNSWKGRNFDPGIENALRNATATAPKQTRSHMIVSALILCFLAMVHEYRYAVTLIPSGILMREQFFILNRFHPQLPIMSQAMLGSDLPRNAPEAFWKRPFSFTIQEDACFVAVRNISMKVPLSRDPRLSFRTPLILPARKHIMRPDFSTFFT